MNSNDKSTFFKKVEVSGTPAKGAGSTPDRGTSAPSTDSQLTFKSRLACVVIDESPINAYLAQQGYAYPLPDQVRQELEAKLESGVITTEEMTMLEMEKERLFAKTKISKNILSGKEVLEGVREKEALAAGISVDAVMEPLVQTLFRGSITRVEEKAAFRSGQKKGTENTRERSKNYNSELLNYVVYLLKQRPNLAGGPKPQVKIAEFVRTNEASQWSVEHKDWNKRSSSNNSKFIDVRKVRRDVVAILPEAMRIAGVTR